MNRFTSSLAALTVALLASAAVPASAEPLKNIVLVHGAWVDASGWKPVFDILTREGFKVTTMRLEVRGVVPGATPAAFQRAAEAAKNGCPISQALAGNVKVEMDAKLPPYRPYPAPCRLTDRGLPAQPTSHLEVPVDHLGQPFRHCRISQLPRLGERFVRVWQRKHVGREHDPESLERNAKLP